MAEDRGWQESSAREELPCAQDRRRQPPHARARHGVARKCLGSRGAVPRMHPPRAHHARPDLARARPGRSSRRRLVPDCTCPCTSPVWRCSAVGPTFTARSAAGDGAGEERWPADRGRRRGRHGGRPRQCSRKETLLLSFFIFPFSFSFLISLINGPSIHVSKSIFSLPC
jgi:hypothetical protein